MDVFAKQKIKYSVIFNNKWNDAWSQWYEPHLTGDHWERERKKTEHEMEGIWRYVKSKTKFKDFLTYV